MDDHLRDPSTLPPEVALDALGELQCTSCHDAHNNQFGQFLVMRNEQSQLCISCHQVGTTTIAEHTNCASCHQPHSAPSGPFLLRQATVTDTCLQCHDGSVIGAADIASELTKMFAHDTRSPVVTADPAQSVTDCADCHDPHTMRLGSAQAPDIHPNFGEITGMNVSGAPVSPATAEYEVCFKCHADGATTQPTVDRWLTQNNTRLEFGPGAVSFHPVAAAGRNPDVPSLLPGWTTASRVACSDCHASDNGTLGVGGVHGSSFEPLLKARYETYDYTSESAQAYALCYSCHDRSSILDDESFPEHNRHIVNEQTSCAVCHDAHGVSSAQGTTVGNSHLINFATSVVTPDPVTGRLEFRDTGVMSGECFLSCHGEAHSPERYFGLDRGGGLGGR
jgi:predicted CXXCH cytochrome family protein